MTIKIQWPRQEIDVVRARLDPKNVRLGLTTQATQNQIINDLFENEDAFELVESIQVSGYFSQEAPIVTMENGVPLVLEGNRRVAALKSLLNPGLVPKYESRIREAISKMTGDVNELQRILVDVAPDRASAERVIANIHTRTTRKPWPPLRQAAFYYAQIESGKRTPQQLATDYPNVDIPYFIRMWEMHLVAVSATYKDPEVAQFAASRRFPISTLERIYRAPEVQAKLRFGFRADGSLQVESDKHKFAAAIGQIVSGIHDRTITSRTLNEKTGAGFAALVKQLPALPKARSQSTARQFQPQTPRSTTRPATSIVPKGFSSTSTHPGVQRRMAELAGLNASRFPHAVIDLLRTLLECGLKAYLDDVGDPIPVGRNGFVQLADVLDHASKHFAANNNRRMAQMARTIRDGLKHNSMPISEVLNAANHNYSTVYIRQDAQDCWDKLQDLFTVILNPPATP
jgi:hypothetical protein